MQERKIDIAALEKMSKKEKVAYLGAKKYKDILRDITKIRNEADMNEVEKTIYASTYCETITTEQNDLLYGILNAMERYAYNRTH